MHSINTSKRVARFYSESFYRIYYFHTEFSSNNCHCLQPQSLLHRWTSILCVIFHLSATINFKINWMKIVESIFHLWKWCHHHHGAGSFLSSQLAAISHFCHFNHFGCFRHHHQIAASLSFYLVKSQIQTMNLESRCSIFIIVHKPLLYTWSLAIWRCRMQGMQWL